MKKTVMVWVLMVMLMGCSMTPSQHKTVSLTHKLGGGDFPVNAERVAVFDMGIVDMMLEYGLPVNGVPKASLPGALKEKIGSDVVDIGTLFEPDFEALATMKPDLIIISGRAAKQYEELSKIAPTLYMGSDSSVEGLLMSMTLNTEMLNQLFPQKDITEKMKPLEALVNLLKKRNEDQPMSTLFVMANGKEIKSFGPGSRYDHVYKEFGFRAVDQTFENSRHGSALSFELVASLNPDIILVMDRAKVTGGEGSAETLMDNDFVKATSAYKNNRVIMLDPEVWYLTEGGYQAVMTMVNGLLEIKQ